MNEGLKINSPEAKKPSEHLKKGVKPIFVSIGSSENLRALKRKHPELPNIHNGFLLENAQDVDWLRGLYGGGRNGALGEERRYIISGIDDANKVSKGIGPCISLIVAGVENGKNVSFMSHQPYFYRHFQFDLQKRLLEMKERCEPGTIDAIIIGGKYNYNTFGATSKEDYLESVVLLSDEVKSVFDFEPVIINGPKIHSEAETDNIYYDNDNRRLYVERTNINPVTGSFTASNIKREKEKWDQLPME